MVCLDSVGHPFLPGLFDDGGSFVLGLKMPEMTGPTVDRETGGPSPGERAIQLTGLFQRYASVGRGTQALQTILGVLGRRYRTQICSSVVATLTVDMVDDDEVTVAYSHDLAMQPDSGSSIMAGRIAIGSHMPTMLIDPQGIHGINQGIRSDGSIASVQRDEGDILVAHLVLQSLDVVPSAVPPARGLSAALILADNEEGLQDG